jgi:predicted RNase H-like HicB family nuclease
MRYAVVIENAGWNFSAYVPDPLREDGSPIPPPSSKVEYIEVAA